MSKIDEKIVFEPTGFDYVNPEAEVVIVGITPGNSQLKGEREGLDKREIKRQNAFAGNMRPNLVKMLDYVGVNTLLSIESCRSLWDENFDKVEMTSLLKEATYEIKKDGTKEMFKHAWKIAKSEKLTKMLNNGFVKDCSLYGKARLYVACGPGVYEVLCELKEKGVISAPIICIAHPSGGNMGRICCYLGTKEPKDASYVWCQEKAKEAKNSIILLMEEMVKIGDHFECDGFGEDFPIECIVIYINGDVAILKAISMYMECEDQTMTYEDVVGVYPDFSDPEHNMYSRYLVQDVETGDIFPDFSWYYNVKESEGYDTDELPSGSYENEESETDNCEAPAASDVSSDDLPF